jgi:ketosteroid isomerase-like protein
VSHENVRLVRAGYDALNAGDLDSLMELWAPDIEVDWSRTRGPLRGVYRGEEAQRLLIDFFESWQSVRVEPHEFIEEGEHVVAPSTTHFVGRDGIGVQARGALTFTIRDGMLVHTGLYQDKQEALKAVGLEE